MKLNGFYRYTHNQHCIQNSPIPCNIGIKTHAVITWNDHIMYNVCIIKFVALTSSQYEFTLHAYFSSATYLWFLQIRLCLKKKKEGKDGTSLRSRNTNIPEMIGEHFSGNKHLNHLNVLNKWKKLSLIIKHTMLVVT